MRMIRPKNLAIALAFGSLCALLVLIAKTNRLSSNDLPDLPALSTPSGVQKKLRLEVVKKSFGGGKNDKAASTGGSSVPSQQSCRLPELNENDPSVRHFFKDPPPLDCGDVEPSWVGVRDGKLVILESAIDNHGAVSCDYTDVRRQSDEHIQETTVKNVTSGAMLVGDFFRVDCHAADEAKFSRVFATVVPSEAARRRSTKSKLPAGATGLNVYMLGFDSLSRLTFKRKLPQFYEYLTGHLKGIVLEGYNIVGDGTPQALIPILTGKTEEELPLTRKRFKNASYVNVYPFVWNEFRDAGYVTLYGEDSASIGTFTYRLKGFKEQPTDHYMRTFYQVAEKQKNVQYCQGSEAHHVVHFRYVEDFWKAYPDERKFAFQFHSILSHDDINAVANADEDMVAHLKQFVEKGHHNNTIFLVMSDHGHRFATLRETQQGKLEERLPFFAFVFPPWFEKKYPQAVRAFRQNSRRLTTPFDIHATLQSLLQFQPAERADLKSRQLSLFEQIPAERTCAQADIEPHWCTCLDWTEVPAQDALVQSMAQAVVDAINGETARERALCSVLSLKGVQKASRYAPATAVLSYKKAKDLDGFVPDLTGNYTVQMEYFQLDLWTTPGNAHYEASVSYNPGTETVLVDLDVVSHVNKFGDAPHCIIDKDYFLAKWCVCMDKI